MDYFLEEINSLPEGIDAKKLEPFFEAIILDNNEFTIEFRLEMLFLLADKQWHSYENINRELGNKIAYWLCANWNIESLDSTEKVTFVACNIGLKQVLDYCKSRLPEVSHNEVRQDIEEFIDEVGENIEDPYYKLKRINPY